MFRLSQGLTDRTDTQTHGVDAHLLGLVRHPGLKIEIRVGMVISNFVRLFHTKNYNKTAVNPNKRKRSNAKLAPEQTIGSAGLWSAPIVLRKKKPTNKTSPNAAVHRTTGGREMKEPGNEVVHRIGQNRPSTDDSSQRRSQAAGGAASTVMTPCCNPRFQASANVQGSVKATH